jgi:hypothetical protein
MAVKTVCPISRETFKQAAQPLGVRIGEAAFTAAPKDFTSGSFGYYANGKFTQTIDGKPVTFQVGLVITAVGSKDLANGGE